MTIIMQQLEDRLEYKERSKRYLEKAKNTKEYIVDIAKDFFAEQKIEKQNDEKVNEIYSKITYLEDSITRDISKSIIYSLKALEISTGMQDVFFIKNDDTMISLIYQFIIEQPEKLKNKIINNIKYDIKISNILCKIISLRKTLKTNNLELFDGYTEFANLIPLNC